MKAEGSRAGGHGEERIERVFAFSRAIRFVSVVGQAGELIASQARPGLASLEPEEATSTVFTRAAIAWGMTEEMNEYHGRIRTAIVMREKVTLVCFFTLDRMFLVFADPDFPVAETERLGQVIDGLSIDQTSPKRLPAEDMR